MCSMEIRESIAFAILPFNLEAQVSSSKSISWWVIINASAWSLRSIWNTFYQTKISTQAQDALCSMIWQITSFFKRSCKDQTSSTLLIRFHVGYWFLATLRLNSFLKNTCGSYTFQPLVSKNSFLPGLFDLSRGLHLEAKALIGRSNSKLKK